MIKLLAEIFECPDDRDKIIIKYPGYFDLDFSAKLPRVIDSFKLNFSNLWYKIFWANLTKQISQLKFNSYKGKILILNNITGLYGEALLHFLASFKNNFDLIDLDLNENCLNVYKKIKNNCQLENKKCNINLLSAANFAQYDLIISAGPSKLLLALLAKKEIKSKLILIDLSVFHGIIEKFEGYNKKSLFLEVDTQRQINHLDVYSCQKINFLDKDRFGRIFNPQLLKIKYFTYIPAYIKEFPMARKNNYLFDMVVLGKGSRDFFVIRDLTSFFANKKILFLAGNKYSPGMADLKKKLDIKIVPRVRHEFYIKLLTLSKIVFIPMRDNNKAVVLSIADALAMGKAIVTSDTPGIEPLQKTDMPLIAIKNSHINKFKIEIGRLLTDDKYRELYEKRALAFARKYINIDQILYNIFKDIEKNILGLK